MQRHSSGDSSSHVEHSAESRINTGYATRPATRPTRPAHTSEDPVEPSVRGQSPRVGTHGTGHTPRLVRNDSSAIRVLGTADESSKLNEIRGSTARQARASQTLGAQEQAAPPNHARDPSAASTRATRLAELGNRIAEHEARVDALIGEVWEPDPPTYLRREPWWARAIVVVWCGLFVLMAVMAWGVRS